MQSRTRKRRPSAPAVEGGTLEAAAMDGLRRIVQQLRVSSSRAEASLGLSSAQLFVLQQLQGEEGLSIRALAVRTRTDPSSVSVVAARLVEKGLVVRREDPEDRRRAALALTPEGARLLRRARPPAQARLLEVLCALPREDVTHLARTLDTLARGMGSPAAPVSMFFEEAHTRGRGRRAR